MGVWLWALLGVVVAMGLVVFTGAPYVPSKRRDIRQALTELYPLGSDDVLVDIGSGDGIVLRIARGYGARAVGYEINPLLVTVSWVLSRKDPAIKTRWGNFWRAELPPDTTVVYTFGDGRDIKKMYGFVQQQATRLGRSVSFISYGFAVPGATAVHQAGASFLYEVGPLQEPRTSL